MAAGGKKIAKQVLRLIILTAPIFGAVMWSCLPAMGSLYGMLTADLPAYSRDQLESSEIMEEIRRSLQQHFLSLGTYIPLEDIVIAGLGGTGSDERLSLLMSKACGHGTVYVWMPFSFRLPFMGNRTLEWCWKPELNLAKTAGPE